MLQPDKSAKRVIAESYNRQFEKMSPTDKALLDITIKYSDLKTEIPTVFTDDQLKLYRERNISPNMYSDMEALLGKSQSGWERAQNSIIRGLAKVPLAFAEPIGYGVDYIAEEAWQDIEEGERDFQNGMNTWLKSIEEQLDKDYPIYTGHMSDEPTILSGGWWAKNGDQMIRSLGYYPYGAIAGRLIGGGLTAMATRGVQGQVATQTAKQVAQTARNIEIGSRLGAATFTGISQNYGEHMYSAGVAFEENYKEYVKLFKELDPQASDEEIDKKARIKAGHDAAEIVKKGKLNLMFEIPSNYMLFRGPGTTRALSQMATSGRKQITQRAATIAYEPTQEYFEEVWTGHLEKEARRKVGIEKGYYDEDYSTEFDRYADHVGSYEGITEGLTGLIGSGPFTIKASMASHKARKAKLERDKKNAAFAGDLTKYRNLNEMSLYETFRFNAQEGTYENMLMHFEDIKNMSPEQAADKGMDPDYKEKAQGAIDRALAFENDFNSHIFQYKDPVKAEILTASKFVQNSIQQELREAETELSKAEVLSTEYFNAKGYPAEVLGLVNSVIEIEALEIAKKTLQEEYDSSSKDVKNNKERTSDTHETGVDIQNRIDHIDKQLEKAIKEREASYKTLDEAGTSVSEVENILNTALAEGAPLHDQAKAQSRVEDIKSRYALENDRYSEFLNNPSKLNKEANNIKARSKKAEDAKKANDKKTKAAEKAAKLKTQTNATKQKAKTEKVPNHGSTSENLDNKEKSDETLKAALESSAQAPEEVKIEVQGPNIDENIDRLLSEANKANNDAIEVFQTMMEGQLTEEQNARLEAAKANNEALSEEAASKNTEQNTNTTEVAEAAIDDKTIGENEQGDRQVKNFNYDKDKKGSIPFERQDSTTEEEDKKLLNNEVKKSLKNDPTGRIQIATKQIIDGANAMAYLATEYVSKIIDTAKGPIFVRRTASKDKTKGLVPEVESPNYLQPGTSIRLKVVDKGSKGLRYVYDNQGMPKEISWTYDDFVSEDGSINSDIIPIEIIAEVQGEEKVIGYVHETTWVDAELSTGQPRNVVRELKDSKDSFDNWSYQKAEIRALRKGIIDKGGEVTTSISEVSTGTPFLNIMMNEDGTLSHKTEWAAIKDLMPGWKNIPLAFRKQGSWRVGKDDHVEEVISNDENYSDGRLGLVLPTKKNNEVFIAPVWTKPLDNTQIDTILYSILALEDPKIAKQISDDLGFNFKKSNPAALATLINRIVYSKKFEFDGDNSGDTVYFDVNANNNMVTIAVEGDRVIYTNKPESVSKSLKDTAVKVTTIAGNETVIRKILQTLLPSSNIVLANDKGSYTHPTLSFGETLQYSSKKYDTYKEYAFDLLQTNINGTNSFTGADGQQEYVYINQPVIQFSKDFEAVSKPEPVAEKESPKSNQVINIYAGTNENKELSNFAIRPFTIEPGMSLDIPAGTYITVEGAFQAAKMMNAADGIYFDKGFGIPLTKIGKNLLDKLQNASGAEAKKLGRSIEKLNVAEWNNNSSTIMEDLIRESFKQNPDALQKLLDTGDATLTHTQDKSKWGKLFPAILMDVREELREKESKKPNQPTVDDILDDLNDDFNYNISYSIEPVQEGDIQPELPFEGAEEVELNKGVYSRLEPFFIDITSIPANRQKDILAYTTAKVTNDFLKSEDLTVNESLESARQTFVKLKNAAGFENKSEVFKNDISSVLANWSKVVELTKEELAIIHNIKPTQKKKDTRNLEKTDYEDEARWKSNPKKKASARMKIKMSQILRRDANGAPIKNYLGLYSFYTYSEVWDGAMGTLTEPIHNLPAMLEHLRSKGKVNPMFSEIATYIDKRLTFEEKNEFVSQFANAYTSQRMLIFNKDKSGNYTAEVIDSAGNKSANIVKERWLTEQLQNLNLIKRSSDGEAYIDVEYVKTVEANYREEFKNLTDKYDTIKERNNSDELFELMASTLTKLSITVPEVTLRYLATPIPNSNKTIGDDILGQAWGYTVDTKSTYGLMNLVFKSYKTNAPAPESVKYDAEVQENAKPLYKNNPLKGDNFQGIILKLADITAQFGDPVYHISYRDGEGKSVFPYNGTTSMHVLLKLYENYKTDKTARSLVDGILTTHMGSVSRLLPKIMKNKNVLKIHYTDSLKDKFSSDARAAKRKNQGILQQDINAAWSFQNSNKTRGFFFGITKADRGISELIEHDKIDFKDQIIVDKGRAVGIQRNAEDHLFNYVMGEMKRIHSTQIKLDESPEYLQGQKYREGSQYFHFFSFLNKHEIGKYVSDVEIDILYPGESFDGIPRLNIVKGEPILRKAINAWTTEIINETVDNWNDLGIADEKKTKLSIAYMTSLGTAKTNVQDKVVIAAGDLELNSIISNIEQQILFGGDIAEAYNGKGNTVAKKIESARAHNEKRLIGTDAPKTQGNFVKREYTSVTFKDRLVFSDNYKYYDKLIGAGSPYGNPSNKSIESTDALEFTTTQEHINFLEGYGQIPKDIHASITAKIKEAIEDENNPTNYYALTKDEMAFALKPFKPQYDFIHPDGETGRLSRIYRKSASIPLLPDMTADMQLDNIRIALEYEKVDRAGHKTSDKLSPDAPVDIYDANGDVLPVEQLRANIKAGTFTLYRDGLGIQQEKNVKKSQFITVPSQKDKLTFSGLLKETFKVKGEEFTGQELQKRKEEIMSAVYEIKHKKLLTRLGTVTRNEDGEILTIKNDEVNMKAFVGTLKEEAKARNWNINDIFSLDLNADGTATIIPLPFIQSRKMLEGLMLSMVNKISDVKMPGIPATQVSSAGFKSQVGAWGETSTEMRNQVITTTNFDETKGLQGPRWNEEKGEVIPGQVMIKFFYRDKDGNEVDLKAKDANGDYIFLFEKNGRLFLNSTKVPKEVRQLMGYRTPYQNLASEMPLEIVGFLPSNMELTIVVPDEILAQMGSDFDYDSLSNIIAQYIVRYNEDGSIKGVYRKDRKNHPDKFTDEELLLDELRDIYWGVLTTNKEAFNKMSKGIDDPALEDLAEDIDGILNANTRTKTPISRMDQIRSNISQRMGQVLIGPAAQSNTLNAIFEGKNIHLVQYLREDKKQKIFKILGLYSEEKYTTGKNKGQYKPLVFSDLSGENKTVYYKKGKKVYRTSSDVINMFLNAAVDNANKPTLGKINMTMETLPTALFMAIGGVNVETIAYMTAQEIMRDYTREIEKIVPGLSDKDIFNKEKAAEEFVLKKYQELAKVDTENEVRAVVEEYSDETNENFEMLFQSSILRNELIVGAPNSEVKNNLSEEELRKYYEKQLVIFKKFSKFKTISDRLNPIRKAVNDPSVKGLGSTISGAKAQIKRFETLNVTEEADKLHPRFGGLSNLKSTQYANLAKHLESGFDLLANAYPTNNDYIKGLETMLVNNGMGKEVTERNMDTIFNSIISNGWSYAVNKVFIEEQQEATSLYELRRKLFVEDNNIAVQALKAKETEWGQKNEFVSSLNPILSTNKNKGKASVGIDWSSNPEDLSMRRGFASLFMGSAEEQEFGKNLIIAAYLNGGHQKATGYLAFIPFGALEKYGLTNHLKPNFFTEAAISEDISLMTQIMQHSPWLATPIDYKAKEIRKHIGVRIDAGKVVTGLDLPSEEVAKDIPAFANFIFSDVDAQRDRYKDFLVYPVGKTHYLFKLRSSIENDGVYYERIDLKGDRYGTEFDFTGNSFSYLEDNKVIKTNETPIPGAVPPPGVPMDEMWDDMGDSLTPEDFEKYDIPQGMPMDAIEDIANRTEQAEYQLDGLLDTIIAGASEGQVELAKMLKQKGIYRSHPMSGVEISDKAKPTANKKGYILGVYKHDPNQLENSKIVIYEGSAQAVKATDRKIAETMLHEVVHYYTVAAIEEQDTSVAAKRFSTAMDNLWVKADKEFKKSRLYTTPKDKLTARQRNTRSEINYALYGSEGIKNVKEFVTGLSTSLEFQKFLNNIPYNKTESLYRKILNTIKSYFKAIAKEMGFDVKEGSALDVGLSEMLVFLNVQEDVVVPLAPEQVRTVSKDKGALAGALGGIRPVMDEDGNMTGETITTGPQATPMDKVQKVKNDIKSEDLRKLQNETQNIVESILVEHSSEWQKKDTGRVTEDGQEIEKYYHHNNPEVEADRVSEFYKKDPFTGDTKLRDTAVNIGNKIDVLVRKVMDNQTPEMPEVYAKVITEIAKRRDGLIADGYKIISDEIVLGDQDLGVAGTTDIVAINKDGELKIIDTKSVRNGTSKLFERGTEIYSENGKKWYIDKWTNQLNMYRLLAERIGVEVKVSSLEILPIRVDYEIGAEDPSYAIVEKSIPLKIAEPVVEDKNVQKFQRWLHRSKDELEIFEDFVNADSNILESRKTPIKYTNDQTKALLTASEFISGEGTKMLLAGYAGTGKTTIIENIINHARMKGKQVVVTAPTNKAVLVISEKLKAVGIRLDSKKELITNHKLLYGAPNPETGQFEPKPEFENIENVLHIMDEASMLAQEEFENFTPLYDEGMKTIFIGDSFQLPPVGKDPKLFTDIKMDHQLEMTEVKRQGLDSSVLTVATNMRNTKATSIPTNSLEDFVISKSVQEFRANWLKDLKENKNVTYISSANPARIAANTLARQELFGKDADVIEDGEVLMSVSNSNPNLLNSKGEEVTTLANGEILGEDRSKKYTKNSERPELTTIYLPGFTRQGEKQTLISLNVQALTDERGNTILLFPDYAKAGVAHQELMAAIQGNFKIQDSKKLEITKDYLDPFITEEKDRNGNIVSVIDKRVITAFYGYAITGHKSQGSQWEKVYIDHGFSGVLRNGKVLFDPTRWLYTAVTRAEKAVEMVPQMHHGRASIEAIRNAVNSQLASNEVKVVNTPAAQKTYASVLEVAVRELAVYRQMVETHGEAKVLEAMKQQFESIQDFEDQIDLEIYESGHNNFIVDITDLPVNAHGEIAEIIQNIQGRIKDLQRRFTLATSIDKRIYLTSRIESLKEDIDKLKEGNNTFVIEDVAVKQLEWAKNILDRPKLSLQEINDASRIVDIWNFENTKHLLSTEQLANQDNPTRKIFSSIGARAQDIGVTMASKRTEWTKEYTQQQSTEPITDKMFTDEGFLNLEDEGYLRGKFLDAANFNNPVVRTIDSVLKLIARNTEDSALNLTLEIQKVFKALKTELKSLGLNEDIFLQKDEEGNPTGFFVSKFTNDYYKDLGAAHKKHKEALKRVMGSTRLTSDQIRQERFEAFKDLYDTKNAMEIVIDTRFWTKDGHTAGQIKSKEEYIKYLEKELGQGNAMDLIGRAEDGVAKYNLEEKAHKNKLATDVVEGVLKPAIGLTLKETADAKHEQWVRKHNPEYYLDQRYNTTISNVAWGTSGWKYTTSHPIGEQYINSEFATIENNEALSEFYSFWTNTMAELKSYLPEVAVNEMSDNFFPSMQRDLLEEYMRNGSVAALSYLGKDTQVYGALFADEVLTLNREKEGLKSELDERGIPISKVPLRFLGSEDVALEERAFDLERVMVMFGNMAMNYKYKAEAEPLVNILMRTVRDSVQPLMDSSGKPIKRAQSNKKVTINTAPEIVLESLEYAQKAIMYGKSRPAQQKTSWEFPGNLSTDMRARHRKAKELKEQYADLHDELADGKITQAQYNEKVEVLEEQFKELNIKAISFNKVIRGFIGYTQLKGMGWNVSAGIANVGFGFIASSIHASGEEDYTSSQFRKAFRIVLNAAMNPTATKTAAILKRMNLLFEMREITYGKGDVRGEKKFKFLDKLAPMYIQQSTEFMVQGMSAVAKMLNTVVVDLQGNKRNLYEAFNENGTWNVKEFGYQKEWDYNNLSSITQNSYTKFRNAAIEMNKKLHGNYDPNSLLAIKSSDFALLFTIFRTWAFEGFNTRYSKKIYNEQLGRYTKGRYNTLWELGIKESSALLMKLLFKRVTGQKAETILSGVEEQVDAANLRKTLAALQMQVFIMSLGMMLKSLAKGIDADDDDQYLLMATLNILFRVEQDLSYYRNPDTFMQVFKDPSPVIKTIQDLTRAVSGTKSYILKDDYRGDHPVKKWAKVFPFSNQIYKWTVITERELDTSYGMSDWVEDNLLEDEE